MDIKQILMITQTVLAVLLCISVLVQQRGTGLSSAIGGSGGGGFHSSRRGVEKVLYHATIILSIAFFGNAIAFYYL